MSKYVIDLEVLQLDPSRNPTLWKAKEFSTLVFDKYGKQKLTPLSSEVCIEELQESGWMAEHDKIIFEQGKTCGVNDIALNVAHARIAGYEDGYNDGYKAAQTEEYQRGLEDAWEAAKKLSIMTPEEAEKVFHGAEKYNRFNLGYSGAEAIKKLQDYMQKEKADHAIRVGDEVKFCHNSPDMEPLVVTALMPNSDKDLLCITVRGKYIAVQSKQVVKTGRHFDQVAELMNAMRGNDE